MLVLNTIFDLSKDRSGIFDFSFQKVRGGVSSGNEKLFLAKFVSFITPQLFDSTWNRRSI